MQAMKTRCLECGKKISIDDAFAGGVCRCPYCKAITVVRATEQNPLDYSPRPERPNRPDSPLAGATSPAPGRPQNPQPAPATPVQQPEQLVPLANRVMVQGVVTIVMSVLLVLFVTTGIAGVWWLTRPGPGSTSPGSSTNPSTVIALGGEGFTQKPGEIAGLPLQSPTVFVIDASAGMQDYYDPAAAMVRHAVRSTKPSDKFQVLLAGEQNQRMSGDWANGGPEADPLLARFFARFSPGGKSELPQAVLLALQSKPRTLVILSSKTMPDASALAQQAALSGAHIVGVALGDSSAAAELMKQLAEKTGGQSVSIPDPESWLEHAPPLPVYQPED